MNPFLKEICQYLADNTSGRFTFGTGNTNLKMGELVRDMDGVYAIQSPSPAPDKYTAIENVMVDFWSQNTRTDLGIGDLQAIYDFFHERHHYLTTNYEVYGSFATGQIDDMGRGADGK